MKCKKCGTEFQEGIFCPECGTRNEENISSSDLRQNQQTEKLEQKRTEETKQESTSKHESEKKVENEGKVMAILSLICGIFSMVTMGCFFIPEILGVIFACFGKKQGKLRGQAIAGLICSLLSIVIFIVMVIMIIIFPNETDGDSMDNKDVETQAVVEEFTSAEEELTEEELTEKESVEEELTEEEISDSNQELNSDEVANIYGTYSVDNGIDANLEAEVGFYTGDCSDYIQLGALSYGGRYLAEFEGILTHIDGNTYQAIENYGDINVILEITFDEVGMQVKVLASEFEEIYTLEGYYQKISELDFNEVG